jgi:hypothetical protein
MISDPHLDSPSSSAATDTKKPTPFEFLTSLPGAPTHARLEELKQQVPGGRLRVFSPDGKRAFLLRGFSGLEMERVQKQVANLADPEASYIRNIVANCVVWTNIVPEAKIDATLLQTAGAGLPQTLFTIISNLSDYFDPEMIDVLSGDV